LRRPASFISHRQPFFYFFLKLVDKLVKQRLTYQLHQTIHAPLSVFKENLHEQAISPEEL